MGLAEVGDTVLPSGRFGIYSRKNAYGCTYADKTKPKERRYVSTNWILFISYVFGIDNLLILLPKMQYCAISLSPLK